MSKSSEPNGRSERFTPVQEALIRARYPTEGAAVLAEEFGRKIVAISDKARRMGLKCTRNGRPSQSICANREQQREEFWRKLISRCEWILSRADQPMTTGELAKLVGLSGRVVGNTLAKSTCARVGCFDNGRDRYWYFQSAAAKKAVTIDPDQQKIHADNDAWYAAIKDTAARCAQQRIMRGRV